MEIMVPMSDGVELHTRIFFPRSENDGEGKFPVVLDRSPYGYGDMEEFMNLFLPFGFVSIGQDMRGTEKSEGNWNMFIDDASDSLDMGNWITEQDWSNGEVYTFGMSADGMGSIQTIENAPSWLKGQYVGWAPSRMYNVLFPHGAYKQKTTEDWVSDLDMTDESWLPTLLQTIHENENHSDEFWGQVEMNDEKLNNVNFPNAIWAGWYDIFQAETLALFDGYNEKLKETKLVVDPCGHCLEAQSFWTQDVVYGRTGLALAQAFEVFGIMDLKRTNIKNITYYVMSSNDTAGTEAGQYWSTTEEWPEFAPTSYYLHADGTASTEGQNEVEASEESTTYAYDPSNPVPTVGGNNLPHSIGGSIPCGPLDQSEVDDRDDVLVFETKPQKDALYLTGPLLADLFVSSDAVDTDFSVKISDVYPTGEVLIISDQTFRMRWRENKDEPDMIVNGTVYNIYINIWNTSYAVAPGHALRFTVSSSNFPRFSVNPNNGLLLADPVYPGKNVTAMNTLYHSSDHQSRFILPVVKKPKRVRVLKELESLGITETMVETFKTRLK
ncbi:hypothetical protein TrVE_jg373 [Triparma verrucosa]|uniref:Xaa-Pro dipeptidyl-peptidase C-terminal domain-containing protein n=1 Tax=Triparma verrucosa TaxID=1606542 RepID=A0A9W7DLL2_9STRA|nr:hypothetical protein TrVE_jg373 [Triparma verrucosa]